MINVEEPQEAGHPLLAAEHVVAAGREQESVGLPRYQRRPKLSCLRHFGKGIAPMRHVGDRVAIVLLQQIDQGRRHDHVRQPKP
jgi:hypothetical protein